jgi:predicted lactoylglutathione lyase
MAGIVFFRSKIMENLRDFYINQAGMQMWVDQGACIILQSGNQLLGFCQRDEADVCGTITFFYGSTQEVDQMHAKLADCALHEPRENPDYGIYHFYARDPEGRSIEFQHFIHELPPLREHSIKLP